VTVAEGFARWNKDCSLKVTRDNHEKEGSMNVETYHLLKHLWRSFFPEFGARVLARGLQEIELFKKPDRAQVLLCDRVTESNNVHL
jgi:hypothetical protein